MHVDGVGWKKPKLQVCTVCRVYASCLELDDED